MENLKQDQAPTTAAVAEMAATLYGFYNAEVGRRLFVPFHSVTARNRLLFCNASRYVLSGGIDAASYVRAQRELCKVFYPNALSGANAAERWERWRDREASKFGGKEQVYLGEFAQRARRMDLAHWFLQRYCVNYPASFFIDGKQDAFHAKNSLLQEMFWSGEPAYVVLHPCYSYQGWEESSHVPGMAISFRSDPALFQFCRAHMLRNLNFPECGKAERFFHGV